MRFRALVAVPSLVAAASFAPAALARSPGLAEYRYFRALTVDLVGRTPTRGELAAFDADGFDVDKWIDAQLKTPAYAARVRRVYLDALRLQIGSTFGFVPNAVSLRRIDVLDEAGKPVPVYFRRGQRRENPVTDSQFCFPPEVLGLYYPAGAIGQAYPKGSSGEQKKLSQAVIDQYTVEVAPWFLYADYKSPTPKALYTPEEGAKKGFVLAKDVRLDADGTPFTKVRVCREEAQQSATGKVLTTGRTTPASAQADKIPGRVDNAPTDDGYVQKNPNAVLDCSTASGTSRSAECGCGVGLERCQPSPSYRFNTPNLDFATGAPLGDDLVFAQSAQGFDSWLRYWWGQEAVRFLDDILVKDADFRTVLTSKSTVINGPLAQFYRSTASVSCCGNGLSFGLVKPTPLFDPQNVPAALGPQDANVWSFVSSRSALASGILTMPVFLTKYGSRRARAHVLYQTFLCKEFVAENAKLQASDDPDLATRPGCSTCHQRLEPLSAYFTRIAESDWTYLPKEHFPIENPVCQKSKPDDPTDAKLKGGSCSTYYDPAFSDGKRGFLRGAHGSPTNAEKGPAGAAEEMTEPGAFSSCAAQQVASSFLGRPLDDGDQALRGELAEAFVKGDFKMATLVREIVKSRAYREGNNLSAAEWRKDQLP